ncbi:hypothetical protein PIB30_006631 [Stylosanthes scabra]|uniref:Uncharacterized protein n=1 Tax=Stylosanthes scabra TaxID=79078 RepID=A0ABU6Q4D3_9FABA|nr:hypothetical protein [Stylosanthes scabra]
MSPKDAAAKMLPLLLLSYSILFTSDLHHSFKVFGVLKGLRDWVPQAQEEEEQHDVLRRKLGEEHKKSCFSGLEPYSSCLPLICLQRKSCLILWLRLWPKKIKGAGNK